MLKHVAFLIGAKICGSQRSNFPVFVLGQSRVQVIDTSAESEFLDCTSPLEAEQNFTI